jgi:hypothetical protein
MASAWRYELALLLLQQGMADEAREQAQICAQLEPSNGDYRALVARVEQARLAAHTD